MSEVVWEAAGSCLRHRRDRLSSRLYCLAQAVARRAALGLMAGAVALIANTPPSEAAFGEAARVFGGKATNTSGELSCKWKAGLHADGPAAQPRVISKVLLGLSTRRGLRRLHPVLRGGLCAAAACAVEPQQGEGLSGRAAAVRQ